MERFPSNFFIPLYGNELIEDFNNSQSEPEIEDIYKFAYVKTSQLRIKTIKKQVPRHRPFTDGLMECVYDDNRFFYGIQEVKYKKSTSDWQIKQQFIQALMYSWYFETCSDYKFKVYIANSEKMLAYLFSDQIQDIKTELYKVFPNVKYTPCVAYKDENVQSVIRYVDLPYTKVDIDSEFKLHETLKTIYKHCL